jgi:hypothetical protein
MLERRLESINMEFKLHSVRKCEFLHGLDKLEEFDYMTFSGQDAVVKRIDICRDCQGLYILKIYLTKKPKLTLYGVESDRLIEVIRLAFYEYSYYPVKFDYLSSAPFLWDEKFVKYKWTESLLRQSLQWEEYENFGFWWWRDIVGYIDDTLKTLQTL